MAAAPAGAAAKPAKTWAEKVAAAKAFLKKNWVGALAFGAGLALVPALNTVLPAVAGLLYWKGEQARQFIEKRLEATLFFFLRTMVLGFVAVKFLF